MSNKSRKRIKHEQRVRIAMLERALRRANERLVTEEPITLHAKFIMRPERDPVRAEAVLKMETERAVRLMVENIIHSGALEIKETRELSLTYDLIKGYELTLRVLKRRY